MSSILSISASPQPVSSTFSLVTHVNRRLIAAGHTVRTLPVRTLPAAPLLVGDVTHPALIDAIAAVRDADALVVATPVYQSSYSGLLKVFLDLLPQFALRGKTVLPLATGGSAAHVLAVDYALRPLLSSLGAAHVTPGWFVPSGHIRTFADGGVLIAAASLGPVAQVTDEFLATLAGRSGAATVPHRVDAAAGPRVSPVAGAGDLQVHRVHPGDPLLGPLLTDLIVEYGTRYGRDSANTRLTEVPPSDFVEPDGAFVVLTEDGDPVAGGAIRRYDLGTAEVKRVWTAHRHRRRGLGLRVMAELEAAAVELGYQRIHLTTGPRQPEARDLYLRAGYTPRFDVSADPETLGPLPFGKELVPGVGLAAWTSPEPRPHDGVPIPDQPVLTGVGQPVPVWGPDDRRHVHSRVVNGARI
jgi:SsuE family FMN reductase